jgi:hypothetical protein
MSDFATPKTSAVPVAGRAQFGLAAANTVGMKWSALHDAARIVAAHAGVQFDPLTTEIRSFPAMVRTLETSRSELVEQGIEDLNTIMERGLSALLAVHARGVSTAYAALALWREFLVARDALLGFLPPTDSAGIQFRA